VKPFDNLEDKTTAEDLISASEAAKIVRVTPQRIGQLLREGELRGKKVGKQWVIDQKSVYQYLRRK
jgi:excisionase family DNA binding protein